MLVVALLVALGPVSARAARPLLDKGQWDSAFALFARESQVPWKRIAVRLDTYSGAPVDFAAYAVDPADVLVAGASTRTRAVDTTRLRPVAAWRFTPPPGFAFESNDVTVPLIGHEGFFVVEARRGTARRQVWINISRIGLLTKESPGGILLWAADLGTGRALRGMRITYLVGSSFAYGTTDADGIARPAGPRPRFALAEWGASRAFVNFVPVSPPPRAVVGVRLDRGLARAGDVVHVVGYVRARRDGALRPAAGSARVSLTARGRTLIATSAALDATGAFTADLTLPADAPSGNVTVLAAAAGATGGAVLRVEAVGDATIGIVSGCGDACPADAEIPVSISVTSHGEPLAERGVRVRIVRTPHVLPPGTPDDALPWATTAILDRSVTTDAAGVASVTIPAPADGLASTYGIIARSAGTTASTRLVTPTAPLALAVSVAPPTITIGEAAVVDVRGFHAADGTPAAGVRVRLRLAHGPNVQQTDVVLDGRGDARATFTRPVLGTSLVTASADVEGGHAFDATAVAVEPDAAVAGGGGPSGDVRIDLDAARFAQGRPVGVRAALAGATGDAFVSIDGARSYACRRVAVNAGRAAVDLPAPREGGGDLSVGAAFVRDGTLYYGVRPLVVDGPGRPRVTALHADRTTFAPGATAVVQIDDGGGPARATVAVRLANGEPAAGADFADAPEGLIGAGTTSQDPASDDQAWHAGIASAHSTAADVYAFDRPRAPIADALSLGVPAPRAVMWRVERDAGDRVTLALPDQKGKYVLSILKTTADGDVGAATLALTVE